MKIPMNKTQAVGFNNLRYLEFQIKAFQNHLSITKGPDYIEFGGKPFDDHHASRVLPGYNPDNKAHILKALNPLVKIVMVVNAKDILPAPYGRTLKGRIRGDSGLRYDQETIRLINRARELGFNIDHVVLSVTPVIQNQVVKDKISEFRHLLSQINVDLFIHYEKKLYPSESFFSDSQNPFELDEPITKPNENLLVFSPGGGSGKFGVILSELYRSLKRGENPSFIKFETFPVYNLNSNHPLNLAYEAATADLGNKVIRLGKNRSNYDKDVENFKLLKKVYSLFEKQKNLIHTMESPIDMGINQIEKGIVDEKEVKEACRQEIIRRIDRYQNEVNSGDEKLPTLNKTIEILNRFDNLYSEK